MSTPAEHFGLSTLGRVTTPGIAGLPPKTWFDESARCSRRER